MKWSRRIRRASAVLALLTIFLPVWRVVVFTFEDGSSAYYACPVVAGAYNVRDCVYIGPATHVPW